MLATAQGTCRLRNVGRAALQPAHATPRRRPMPTIRLAKSACDKGRRWGALVLFRLSSCLLRCSANLFRRRTISRGELRVVLSIVTFLERSAALLLLGGRRRPDQPRPEGRHRP